MKLLLLLLDPTPKFYLGDSRSYWWTAVSGWIPEDRSFFYGYVIRWVSLSLSSWIPLLTLQTLCGATVSILVAWICYRCFGLSRWVSFGFGFFCSIDPLQLFWEHAVMTEALSLVFYVWLLQRSFIYLTKPRLRELVFIQILSVLAIGFRMSYLILVLTIGATLPLFAFYRREITGPTKFLRPLSHFAVSVALMASLHLGYRRFNGYLSQREPDYLYGTGFHLVSFWAPALEPEDAADDKMRTLIEHGNEFKIWDIDSRPQQRFLAGCLVDRLCHLEPDTIRASAVAKQTALHVLRRDPLAVAGITVRTYLEFWRWPGAMRWFSTKDISGRQLTNEDVTLLRDRFHQIAKTGALTDQASSWVAHYYVAGWPYYEVIALSPLFWLVVIFFDRSRATLWLGLNLTVLFGSTFFLSIYPIVRYLHPLSILTLLTLAVFLRVIRSQPVMAETVTRARD